MHTISHILSFPPTPTRTTHTSSPPTLPTHKSADYTPSHTPDHLTHPLHPLYQQTNVHTTHKSSPPTLSKNTQIPHQTTPLTHPLHPPYQQTNVHTKLDERSCTFAVKQIVHKHQDFLGTVSPCCVYMCICLYLCMNACLSACLFVCLYDHTHYPLSFHYSFPPITLFLSSFVCSSIPRCLCLDTMRYAKYWRLVEADVANTPSYSCVCWICWDIKHDGW